MAPRNQRISHVLLLRRWLLLIGLGMQLAVGAQSDSVNWQIHYPDIKVYKSNEVVLESFIIETDKGTKPVYKADSKTIDERKFRYLSKYNQNLPIDSGKPYYVTMYDADDHLLWEGERFGDCGVGLDIEYYPNGKPKLIGHFKVNDSGSWDELGSRGYCSSMDGIWTYFTENGILSSTESYRDNKKDGTWTYYDQQGKLVRTEEYKENKLLK